MSRRRSYLAIGAALLGCQADAFVPRLVGSGGVSSSCWRRNNSDGPECERRTESRLYVGGRIDPAEDRNQAPLKADGGPEGGERLYVGGRIDPAEDRNQAPLKADGGPEGGENADLLPAKEADLPFSALWSMLAGTGGGPPVQVDDTNLLIYDVFLLVNLSASISFWVVHRMNFLFLAESLNEGALLCICWIISGLANGAFLYSAVDGHWDPSGKDADKGGPKAAGLLGLSTFVGASSIRILIALAVAVADHRPVGSGGEALIPLEILVGLILMSSWRALHSANTPRL
uniref:Uncharacterized protein n=1 Tax=Minutocellus polymorphus TaxID=265543 RepID=A0A7S0B382_9STRA|mmetsp:Transcript_9841/g.16313  ORF Transcript_9841/g.16313 Transcript_9841/m.16313 type:complete len:288 (+) Transcript_9841:72-935(+)